MNPHGLISLLSATQVEAIERSSEPGRGRHPAWTALHAFDHARDYKREPKDYDVNAGVDNISRTEEGAAWLHEVTRRVAQTTDFAEAASALAEIRSYGALLNAGLDVRPIPTSNQKGVATPDFAFQLDIEEGVVEVTTKLEDGKQVERAARIARGEEVTGVERSTVHTTGATLSFTAFEHHPFGAPDPSKAGDTTQTNAISRVCAIKAKETQYGPSKPSLLWIDFRDFSGWSDILSIDNAYPLISGNNGTLTAGALWYGFYGWKGAEVFAEDMPGRQSVVTMAHFGRFHPDANKHSRYSAAVICLSKHVLLYENPMAPVPVSDAIRHQLRRLKRFNIGASVADWSPGHLQRSLDLGVSLITSFRSPDGT